MPFAEKFYNYKNEKPIKLKHRCSPIFGTVVIWHISFYLNSIIKLIYWNWPHQYKLFFQLQLELHQDQDRNRKFQNIKAFLNLILEKKEGFRECLARPVPNCNVICCTITCDINGYSNQLFSLENNHFVRMKSPPWTRHLQQDPKYEERCWFETNFQWSIYLARADHVEQGTDVYKEYKFDSKASRKENYRFLYIAYTPISTPQLGDWFGIIGLQKKIYCLNCSFQKFLNSSKLQNYINCWYQLTINTYSSHVGILH